LLSVGVLAEREVSSVSNAVNLAELAEHRHPLAPRMAPQDQPDLPDLHAVRRAALELLGLAACFDRRRPDVRDPNAETTLRHVVAALEVARERFEKRRRSDQGIVPDLVDAVTGVYRDVRRGLDQQEQRVRLQAAYQAKGIPLTPKQLGMLAATKRGVSDEGGPKMCAQARVGRTFEMSQTNVRNLMKATEADPATLSLLTSQAFNVGVSDGYLIRYLLTLLGWTDEEILPVSRLVDARHIRGARSSSS
jgi:hypothetical protein